VFGGDNIPDSLNSNPEAAAAFRQKLGDSFVGIIESPQSEWKDVVVVGL
jgi:hypothetical protein